VCVHVFEKYIYIYIYSARILIFLLLLFYFKFPLKILSSTTVFNINDENKCYLNTYIDIQY